MSNGPHVAADMPPDAERCPHYHRDANPTVPNANPHCPGRCIFYARHPHPLGGHRDAANSRSVREYQQNFCLCGTCHLWVKDWGQTG